MVAQANGLHAFAAALSAVGMESHPIAGCHGRGSQSSMKLSTSRPQQPSSITATTDAVPMPIGSTTRNPPRTFPPQLTTISFPMATQMVTNHPPSCAHPQARPGEGRRIASRPLPAFHSASRSPPRSPRITSHESRLTHHAPVRPAERHTGPESAIRARKSRKHPPPAPAKTRTNRQGMAITRNKAQNRRESSEDTDESGPRRARAILTR